MQSNLVDFQIHRNNLYSQIPQRRDACFNLLDSLCSDGSKVRSVVELSESKYFPRKYSSVTDSIVDGFSQVSWKDILSDRFCRDKGNQSYYRFVVDATSRSRTHSKVVKDRCIVHAPNPAPGNKPITVGHQYSVVVQLPPGNSKDRKAWVLPLKCSRISSNDKGAEKGMTQINSLVKKLGLEEEKTLSIGDTAYGSSSCWEKVREMDKQVHPKTKQRRLRELMQAQEEISRQKLKNKVGQITTCLVEERSGDSHVLARTCWDAPEIDGTIILKGRAQAGEMVQAKISGSTDHDLYGDIL